jgi:hypothetical protein
VNAGNYLGQGRAYASRLFSAVSRNLSGAAQFKCFTDDPKMAGMMPPLPHPGLKGWMNKLALFKPGVFAEGERVLYLDLDTVIAGSLDDIASYDGEFAMLEDFTMPKLLASGVMAWRGGFGAHIWERYVAAGMPDIVRFDGIDDHPGGDGAWIMGQVPNAGVLQDLYPNQIASYKVSGGVLAPQTRVCCFHGAPRPHEVTTGWVPAMWKGTNGLPR